MKKVFLRTVKELFLEEVAGHLLVVGDLSGDCFSCREVGLNYASVKQCPHCGVDFRYVASRKSKISGIKILSSLQRKRPDLVCIELEDMLYFKNRERAKDLFA